MPKPYSQDLRRRVLSGEPSAKSAISSSPKNAKTTLPPPDVDSAERPALTASGAYLAVRA
jgi:hypothetical protein